MEIIKRANRVIYKVCGETISIPSRMYPLESDSFKCFDSDNISEIVDERIIEWRVKPRPIRLHINKTYAVCCPSDVSAGFIFSSYICKSSHTYVYGTLYAGSPHIL